MIAAPIAPLFVPGDRPERFVKAAATNADSVIIYLEDAVDASFKGAARANLLSHSVSGKPIIARINSAASEWWIDDLRALTSARIDGVMVPKTESAGQLEAVARVVGEDVAIIPLIETVIGFFRLDEILKVPRVLCVGFGSLDFSLDAGLEHDWEPLLYTRSRLVLSSRLARVAAPIDGVTPTLDDPALVESAARRARSLGFGGKLAIHPTQTAPILAAFLPTVTEIAWAKKVTSAARSDSAVKIDGQMIDKPLVEKARRIMCAAGCGREVLPHIRKPVDLTWQGGETKA